MRSAVVVSAGRSGSSMLAGCLARAGWNTGADLLPPTANNPRGFYESIPLNDVNRWLIAFQRGEWPRMIRRSSRRMQSLYYWIPDRMPPDPPPLAARAAAAWLRALRMPGVVPPTPFVVKDPRFVLTLDAWRPVLGDAAFLCVFRDPASTAKSIHRFHAGPGGDRPYRGPDPLAAYAISYRLVLDQHCKRGDWMFVDFDSLLDGRAAGALEAFLGAAVGLDHVDDSLPRHRPAQPEPSGHAGADAAYAELRARAGADLERLAAAVQ